MPGQSVVKVNTLCKRYGKVKSVDGISFEVYQGEIFGMVGPNGAGKTTTIECIESLRRPDAGEVEVLGLDPVKDHKQLCERIGVQLQESSLPDRLHVDEALDLFSSFYRKSINWQELLLDLGLQEKARNAYVNLSGGQKQRLFIALALVNDPEIVFFDELTTGLDPQARRTMWELVHRIRDKGKTVFLTTHFMEEAERLCDRVAIIDCGKLIALDTPENLIRDLKEGQRIIFTLQDNVDPAQFHRIKYAESVAVSSDRITISGSSDHLISEVVNFLTGNGIHFRDLRTEQPSLEDVFLKLTGHQVRN
ncbi:MAG: ABC transporter ATP-binding protein [Candidatus Cloacimonetes bacterium]|nr:ABC transporter ATP-binding protein [Candidatus Cloacimonadota bacterium]